MKESKHSLETISVEELKGAYKKQCEKGEWNFYDERKHIEDLLCQRFNYLILAFSLFTTAFATIEGKNNKLVVLIVGLVILTLLGGTVRRAYLKLDINLKILHKLQDADTDDTTERAPGYNVLAIVDKEVKTRPFQFVNMNKAIGFWIPLSLLLCFAVGIVAIAFGWWSVC